MARAARGMEVDGPRFFDNADEAAAALNRGVTLAFSSGTLPAVPNPRALLRCLVDLHAPYMAVVRVGLHNGAQDITNVQESTLSTNEHGLLPVGVADAVVRYPFTICSRPAVEDILNSNYETLVRTEEIGGYLVNGARLLGYYCRII